MDKLVMVKSIKSLNSVDGLEKLFEGTAEEAALSKKKLPEREAMVAVFRLLCHCERTLTKLDLR